MTKYIYIKINIAYLTCVKYTNVCDSKPQKKKINKIETDDIN